MLFSCLGGPFARVMFDSYQLLTIDVYVGISMHDESVALAILGLNAVLGLTNFCLRLHDAV